MLELMIVVASELRTTHDKGKKIKIILHTLQMMMEGEEE